MNEWMKKKWVDETMNERMTFTISKTTYFSAYLSTLTSQTLSAKLEIR